MPTTIKTGWLKDKEGNKFAPKTLTSQVQTSDGTLIEDKIQADLAEKQNALTGTQGQVIQIDANGKAAAVDLNLITVEDIDTICGGAIQYAEDVMF